MVDANIGTDAGDDKSSDRRTILQPGLETGADVRTDRVLGKDGKEVRERQIVQFVNRLALLRARHAVRREGGELDGVGVVGVLEQQKVTAPQVVDALEERHHTRDDTSRARAGKRPLVAEPL